MKGKYWVALTLISISFLAGSFFFFLGSVFSLLPSGGSKPDKGNIAIVEITGGIYDPVPLIDQLREIRKEKSIKALVLRVDSPGGSVGASQEIYEAVKEFRTVKPVVVSMGTVAASGAYYISLPANKIVANPGTITGSIGVRMDLLNTEELLQWAHLKATTLKSGLYKDVGSPTRAMTDEEKKYLESLLSLLHDQFKQAVVEGRGLKREDVNLLAEGQVFTGLQAKEKGLVDELGGLEKAVGIASGLAGLPQSYQKPEPFYPSNREGRWERWIQGSVNHLITHLIHEAKKAEVNFSYD